MTEALNQTVLSGVILALRHACHLPDAVITAQTRFIEDLGLDSLDMVEVAMELEAAFQIELPENPGERFGSVGQAAAYLSSRYFRGVYFSEEPIEQPWPLAA